MVQKHQSRDCLIWFSFFHRSSAEFRLRINFFCNGLKPIRQWVFMSISLFLGWRLPRYFKGPLQWLNKPFLLCQMVDWQWIPHRIKSKKTVSIVIGKNTYYLFLKNQIHNYQMPTSVSSDYVTWITSNFRKYQVFESNLCITLTRT